MQMCPYLSQFAGRSVIVLLVVLLVNPDAPSRIPMRVHAKVTRFLSENWWCSANPR